MPDGLQKTVFDVPFTGGLNEKVDPIVGDAKRLLGLSNYQFDTNGTLYPRDAWTAISAANSLPAVTELATLGPELLAVDGGSLKSFTPNSSSQFRTVGAAPGATVRKDRIYNATQFSIQSADACTSGNLTLFVWSVNAQTWYTVRDETTGGITTPATQITDLGGGLTNRGCVRCCVVSTNTAMVTWAANATIGAALIDLPSGAVTAGPTATVTDMSYNVVLPNPSFDMIPIGGFGGYAAVLYYSNVSLDATSTARVAIINSALSVSSGPVTVCGTGTLARVDVGYNLALAAFTPGSSTTKLACILGGRTNTQVTSSVIQVTAYALGSVTGPSTHATLNSTIPFLVAGVLDTGQGLVQAFYGDAQLQSGFTSLDRFVVDTSNNIATFVTLFGVVPNVSSPNTGRTAGPYLAGKPFYQGGKTYIPIAMSSTLQNQVLISDISGNIVAKAMYGSAYWTATQRGALPPGPLPSVVSGPSGWSMAYGELGTISFSSGAVTTQAGLSRLLFAFGRSGSPAAPYFMTPLWRAQTADELFLSGANPLAYDGQQLFELGFHYFPELASTDVALVATMAGSVDAGVHGYTVVYEWVDNRGRRYQSAPSVLQSVTHDASHTKTTITIPPLMLGVRAASASIVIYRTLHDATIPHRLYAASAPLANNTTVASVSYTDAASDASISANEILYTVGGALPNNAPPSFRTIAVEPGSGRLVIAGLENPYEVRFSQAPVSGQGVYWNETLSVLLPPRYGEPTAVAFMDGQWYVWTRLCKYVIPGQFPDVTGANGSLQAPYHLPGQIGCIDQRSVVLLPDGIGYQSQHGYYLLDRARNDQYVEFGLFAETDILASEVTSAVFLENRSRIALTLSSGSILSFDYNFKQWSKFSAAGTTPVSAVNWQGVLTFADSGHGWLAQDNVAASINYRNGDWRDWSGTGSQAVFARSWQTSWLKTGAIQGFQRIWRVGLAGAAVSVGNSNVSATLTLYTNYAGPPLFPAAPAAETVNLTIATATLPTLLRHHVTPQKSASLSIAYAETPSSSSAGASAGFAWSGVTLEAGVKRGALKAGTTV